MVSIQSKTQMFVELAQKLNYVKETGALHWIHLNKPAGGISPIGYFRLTYKNVTFYHHHVIWYMHYGVVPTMLDHIDGNRDNNRLENLREVCHNKNAGNKAIHRAGKLVGATFCKGRRKWQARVVINKVRTHLGYYNTAFEANKVYLHFLENLTTKRTDNLS